MGHLVLQEVRAQTEAQGAREVMEPRLREPLVITLTSRWLAAMEAVAVREVLEAEGQMLWGDEVGMAAMVLPEVRAGRPLGRWERTARYLSLAEAVVLEATEVTAATLAAQAGLVVSEVARGLAKEVLGMIVRSLKSRRELVVPADPAAQVPSVERMT